MCPETLPISLSIIFLNAFICYDGGSLFSENRHLEKGNPDRSSTGFGNLQLCNI